MHLGNRRLPIEWQLDEQFGGQRAVANRPIAFPNLLRFETLDSSPGWTRGVFQIRPNLPSQSPVGDRVQFAEYRWFFGFGTEMFFQHFQTSKDHGASSQSAGVRLRIQFESNESSGASVTTDGSEPLGS